MEISNIFVLHSLNGDTAEFWGKDIVSKFKDKIDVYMPAFPIRAESSYEKFDAILSQFVKDGILNEKSLVIAHSIGNAYFVRFMAKYKIKVAAFIAVAPGAVYEYPSSRNDYIVKVEKQAYLKPYELVYVKNNQKNVVCLYSDEDDNNLEKFTRFINDTGAKSVYLKGYNHFDGYHYIYSVPELVSLIEELIEK